MLTKHRKNVCMGPKNRAAGRCNGFPDADVKAKVKKSTRSIKLSSRWINGVEMVTSDHELPDDEHITTLYEDGVPVKSKRGTEPFFV